MVKGCGANVAKVCLIVVNIIFVLLGLGIGIAGLVFKFGTDIFKSDIQNVLSNVNLDVVGGIDMYSLVDSLANLFIIVGFIIFAIGFFGCCGACCQWRWMLVIYAIVVMLLLIAQIVALSLFAAFKSEFTDTFKNTTLTVFKEKYGKDDDVTKGFNEMFSQFKCCGINGKDDFNAFQPPQNPPNECCGGSCTNNRPDDGCFEKLKDFFGKYTNVFIGVSVGILIFQLLCIIFSFCLCVAIGRDDVV